MTLVPRLSLVYFKIIKTKGKKNERKTEVDSREVIFTFIIIFVCSPLMMLWHIKQKYCQVALLIEIDEN